MSLSFSSKTKDNTDTSSSSTPVHSKNHEDIENRATFEKGDHIYSWRTIVGVPAFQHHGIIIDIASDGTWKIIDFGAVSENGRSKDLASLSTKVSNSALFGDGRISELTLEQWREVHGKPKKVQYGANWLQRSIQFAGTCTSVESDPPELVVARVRFLLENEGLIPAYHVLKHNCECVAVWCMTGQYATLQGSSFLHLSTFGQVKGSATMASYVACQSVSVVAPSPGVWGWLGFQTVTKVPLIATNPFILPLIAAYGIVSITGPLILLHNCRGEWKRMTGMLHNSFWSMASPEAILACIDHWSGLKK